MPDPGDWTVCINCAFPLRFDADLKLEKLAAPEIAAALLEQPVLGLTIAAIRKVIMSRGR